MAGRRRLTGLDTYLSIPVQGTLKSTYSLRSLYSSGVQKLFYFSLYKNEMRYAR
jgi:hypothetical protein